MRSPYLFALQQALKVGYFTGCAFKIRITFTQNYDTWLLERRKLGYFKEKLFFIRISSIASFKPFLIAWLWEYCTFSPFPRLGQKDVLVRCSFIVPDHNAKIAGHFQNLVGGQCPLTDCNFQHWVRIM